MAQPQTTPRSLKHWLSHYQPKMVMGVTVDGEEHRIVVPSTTKKWDAVARDLANLDCVQARAYDKDGPHGQVLATLVLRVVENEGVGSIGGASMSPATAGGVDVAAIVHALATAITTSVNLVVDKLATTVLAEQGKAQAVAFAEMVNITKVATQDASEFRKMVHQDLLDRRQAVEDEREEREQQWADREAEREREREENAAMGDVMKPLLAAAAPEIMSKLSDYLTTKKAPPVPVKVDVKQVAKEGSPNGSGS
jgi:hypothetical protein